MLDCLVRFGVQEHDPEVVMDDVERDLALAYRALHEGLDDVLGVVQQKPVANARRNLGIGQEGVRTLTVAVIHPPRRCQPG